MAKNWKKIEERKVFSTPYFSINAKTYTDSESFTDDFYTFKFTDWVHVIPILPNGDIILVKQFRFGRDSYSLEFPGGQVDGSEEPLFAAKRELREETGYRSDELELIGSSYPNPATHENKCWYYRAKNLVYDGELQLDAAEDIEIIKLTALELESMIFNGEIKHSLALVGYLFHSKHR